LKTLLQIFATKIKHNELLVQPTPFKSNTGWSKQLFYSDKNAKNKTKTISKSSPDISDKPILLLNSDKISQHQGGHLNKAEPTEYACCRSYHTWQKCIYYL